MQLRRASSLSSPSSPTSSSSTSSSPSTSRLSSPATPQLAGLAGLRSAPSLDPEEALALRRELEIALARCEWFTIGIMASDGPAAVAALRRVEAALDWTPLEPQESAAPAESTTAGGGGGSGSVFLKGNQRTGSFLLRREAGLGVGLLITGHSSSCPEAEATWGPLPLDLFEAASPAS